MPVIQIVRWDTLTVSFPSMTWVSGMAGEHTAKGQLDEIPKPTGRSPWAFWRNECHGVVLRSLALPGLHRVVYGVSKNMKKTTASCSPYFFQFAATAKSSSPAIRLQFNSWMHAVTP